MLFDDVGGIMLPEEIQTEKFNKLSVEEQNLILRDALTHLYYDYNKLVEIVFDLQNNIRLMNEYLDDNECKIHSQISYMDEKISKHVGSVHSCLIVGKDKKE